MKVITFPVGAYQPVDFQSPVTTLWAVAVLLVVALLVFAHAAWRRRHHLRFAERTGRNPDPNLLRDARMERIVSLGVAALALVLAGFAALGAWQTHQNVRSNLAEKYGVTAVEQDGWTGSFLVADLTFEDGRVEPGHQVYFEPDGEPLIGEDILPEVAGGS